MNNLILGYKRGMYRCKAIQTALSKFQQKSTIITDEDDLDNIEGSYDRIFTMSESLLPLQYKLEQQLGIDNLTEESVEILTNKFRMDEYVRSLGLDIAPQSVLPTCAEDLDVFEDKSVFLKPVVGSGTKDQYNDYRYMAFKNKDVLLKHVSSFETWTDPDFNNMKNQLMVQEHLHDDSIIYALYIYVNSRGEVTPLYWIQGNAIVQHQSDDCWKPRNTYFQGIPDEEVPEPVKPIVLNFFEKLVKGLKLKNILMVADFYYFNDTVKFIDVNPRIGQGMVLYDDLHDNEFIPSVFAEMPLPKFKRHLWKETQLKPGKIKSIGDYKSIEGADLASNFNLHEGVEIPEEYFISGQHFHFALFISRKEKTDMHEAYRSSHEQLQSCIEYY